MPVDLVLMFFPAWIMTRLINSMAKLFNSTPVLVG